MQVKIHGVAKHAQSECRSLEEEEKKKVSTHPHVQMNTFFFGKSKVSIEGYASQNHWH